MRGWLQETPLKSLEIHTGKAAASQGKEDYSQRCHLSDGVSLLPVTFLLAAHKQQVYKKSPLQTKTASKLQTGHADASKEGVAKTLNHPSHLTVYILVELP